AVSQVDLVLALLGAVWLAWQWVRRHTQLRTRVPGLLLATSLGLVTLAHFRYDEYRMSPGAMEVLMGAVGRAGLQRPVLSSAVQRSDSEHSEPVTLFGTHARAGEPPWLDRSSAPADGFVDLVMLPEEAYARFPGHFVKAPGATLFVGDLHTNPLPD